MVVEVERWWRRWRSKESEMGLGHVLAFFIQFYTWWTPNAALN
jgi:hypothetical protein